MRLPQTPAVGAPERRGAPDSLDRLKRSPGERVRGSLGPKPNADAHPPEAGPSTLPQGGLSRSGPSTSIPHFRSNPCRVGGRGPRQDL